jgi:uncharacterized membrane protein YfcA
VLTLNQDLSAVACGSFVGFALALTGGGGSILAVPLLIYVVGLNDPHLAIGTSALAVSINAGLNLVPHARVGNVRWKEGAIFAAAGVAGALAGSSFGKLVDGQHLLTLFALLMLVVAGLMLKPRGERSDEPSGPTHLVPRLLGAGLGAGGLSGFFGIGGGFLIVPGLMLASRMKIIQAVGTSLVGVGAFGMATALNYTQSGWVNWPLALLFIAGGAIGGWFGARAAQRLAATRGALNMIFASMIVLVAIYMLTRGATSHSVASQGTTEARALHANNQ